MIRLVPSAGIKKATNIDYELLSFIIGRFILPNKRVILHVHKTRGDYSYYCEDGKVIAIDLKSNDTFNEIVKTILHELRHYIQTKHFKIEFTDYTCYRTYYNCPEEKDARNFEKLSTEVCHIYKSYVKILQKIKDLNLDEFYSFS